MSDRLAELREEYQRALSEELAVREQLRIKEAACRKVVGEINDLVLAEHQARKEQTNG